MKLNRKLFYTTASNGKSISGVLIFNTTTGIYEAEKLSSSEVFSGHLGMCSSFVLKCLRCQSLPAKIQVTLSIDRPHIKGTKGIVVDTSLLSPFGYSWGFIRKGIHQEGMYYFTFETIKAFIESQHLGHGIHDLWVTVAPID